MSEEFFSQDRFEELDSLTKRTSPIDKKPEKKKKKQEKKTKGKKEKKEKKRKGPTRRQVRERREAEELSRRIALLESQGRTDQAIVAELAKRGISRSGMKKALLQHLEEHPGHGQFDEESIDAMLDGVPTQPSTEHIAYNSRQQSEARLYNQNRSTYQASTAEETLGRRTNPAEYRFAQDDQQQIDPVYKRQEQRQMYQRDESSASRIDESIDDKTGIKIGGRSLYKRNFDP